jgi:uncharacterized protein (DUF433 family)
VIDFLRAGYSTEAILREFPDLMPEDVTCAALEMDNQAA